MITASYITPIPVPPNNYRKFTLIDHPQAPFGAVLIELGYYVPATPLIPGRPPTPQQSGPNRDDFVRADPGTPDTPAIPEFFGVRESKVEILTEDQWYNWPTGSSDDAYLSSLFDGKYGIVPQSP